MKDVDLRRRQREQKIDYACRGRHSRYLGTRVQFPPPPLKQKATDRVIGPSFFVWGNIGERSESTPDPFTSDISFWCRMSSKGSRERELNFPRNCFFHWFLGISRVGTARILGILRQSTFLRVRGREGAQCASFCFSRQRRNSVFCAGCCGRGRVNQLSNAGTVYVLSSNSALTINWLNVIATTYGSNLVFIDAN